MILHPNPYARAAVAVPACESQSGGDPRVAETREWRFCRHGMSDAIFSEALIQVEQDVESNLSMND
ncbi:hypothetical protein DAPPUDRAFT_244902 [Daphnia pulex]|uniref:Uncharacterized protein n=1 Tax=Daphnia pulex TaxID=6669 RepID=E9GM40_DAPPU|nr:hypothetical protein DAPPUDRAFT_244902 [Daphnia pulex]|eukprot:EFX79456.1 hypothetical protein DAPPUDRAFT_244902 [Daphnia pulex]